MVDPGPRPMSLEINSNIHGNLVYGKDKLQISGGENELFYKL